ncbi:CDP-alcohol phosphatidyltransferase family protein [Capnocytophaga sp. oral taxon 903]|uniref:CDP-alcohol phosphatidyltransferase family protein n=1 Tax=Capnocytophaga sp. oral taxon 903 TaxID=2748317 RepID=UPI0015BB534E|nr:CDP-alcohol phosphatidyltransferase family protein [Capnocytophaga sp. oral taxon 903]NWO30232.1 CDP-alcohol phosphatidyltransferase family protein [Capnocytophaga sp. oral taxon 903]
MKKYVPNLITLSNLLCGTVAIVFAVRGTIDWAALFVAIGIFLDFFDGFFARLLHVKSEMGLQLDSLADMVTSGVVPGIVMFQLLSNSTYVLQTEGTFAMLLPYVGFFITLASAYRLANFNIDTRQTSGFIGLPTPANTMFILSLPLILQYQPTELFNSLLHNMWVLLGITLLSAYLLNAEIALFALKFSDYSFKNNALKYIFLALCIILLLSLKIIAIPLIILLYIILSLLPKR